ncbi:MAG: hypothetical protein QNJ48_13455, partial [Desulfobacterales bacterium]|nr:hypothetical protein [Desulfobacterales bacterium]
GDENGRWLAFMRISGGPRPFGDAFACQQTSQRFLQRVVKCIGGLFFRDPSRSRFYAACLEEAQESPGAS